MTETTALSPADDWIEQSSCPACGATGRKIGTLFSQRFVFGGTRTPPPREPIRLMRCTGCELMFKNIVASPGLLTRLTQSSQARLWSDHYDYSSERAAIDRVDPAAAAEVLDVGAAGGGFLAAFPQASRTSALDIVRFDTLTVSDEFISGFIDDADLSWSEKPYSLVGLFDVAEHLYDPRQAFLNLRKLCRDGGLVIVETGDSDSIAENDAPHWYYLNLIEHHMAWNRRSIERVVHASGFEVASFERKAHKNDREPAFRERLRILGFSIAPRMLQTLYSLMGKTLQVPSKHQSDHMRLILRAV